MGKIGGGCRGRDPTRANAVRGVVDPRIAFLSRSYPLTSLSPPVQPSVPVPIFRRRPAPAFPPIALSGPRCPCAECATPPSILFPATPLTPVSSPHLTSSPKSRPAPTPRRKQVQWAEPLPTKRQSSPRFRPSSPPVALPRVDMNVLLAKLKAIQPRLPAPRAPIPVSTPSPTPVPLMSLRIPRPPSLPLLPSPVLFMSLRIPCTLPLLPSASASPQFSASLVCPMASSFLASQSSVPTPFFSINIPFFPDLVETHPSSPLVPFARARVCEICGRAGHGTLGR